MMLMGIVFPPNPEHNFNEKVKIKCIRRTRQFSRDTYHANKFHNDHYINQLLITWDWRQIYDNKRYTASEILALIVDFYELDDNVTKALPEV